MKIIPGEFLLDDFETSLIADCLIRSLVFVWLNINRTLMYKAMLKNITADMREARWNH